MIFAMCCHETLVYERACVSVHAVDAMGVRGAIGMGQALDRSCSTTFAAVAPKRILEIVSTERGALITAVILKTSLLSALDNAASNAGLDNVQKFVQSSGTQSPTFIPKNSLRSFSFASFTF